MNQSDQDDLTLIARTVAEHDAVLVDQKRTNAAHKDVLLAFRAELVELRRLIEQNLIRIKLLERRGQEPKREER